MPRKNANRAAVSNGTKLLPGKVDGRNRFSRRYRDLVADIAADLGGADKLSVIRMLLVRRVAALAAHAETIEADLAAGKPADLERLSSIVALLARLARQLGLDRIDPEKTALTLAEYLAQRDAEPAEAIDDEDEPDAENEIADNAGIVASACDPVPSLTPSPEPKIAPQHHAVAPAPPANGVATPAMEIHALAAAAAHEGVNFATIFERRRLAAAKATP